MVATEELNEQLGNFDRNGEVQISSSTRRFRSGGLGSSGSGEGLRACQFPSGLGLGDALLLPKENLAGAMWVLRASEASAVRRMCGRAAPDHHCHLARVQVESLASVTKFTLF